MVFSNLYILVLWMKIASALEGLRATLGIKGLTAADCSPMLRLLSSYMDAKIFEKHLNAIC